MRTAKEIMIIVGFSRPKGIALPWYSWLIRWVIRKPYSHVYVRWKSASSDTHICYHASGTQVHFLNGKKFREKVEPVIEYRTYIDRIQYKDLIKVCMRHAGENYGKLHALTIGISTLARNYLSREIPNREKGWACSSIAALIMGSVFNEELERSPSQFDPGMIEDYCKADSDFMPHLEAWETFDLEVKDYGGYSNR